MLGDGFGELGIINKTRRSATVVNNSIKPLCLLGFDKQSYYDIQGMPLTKESSVDYLKEKVDVFEKLDYPFDLVNFKLEDYMLINYRRSLLIFLRIMLMIKNGSIINSNFDSKTS
jgi:hypothetical protein